MDRWPVAGGRCPAGASPARGLPGRASSHPAQAQPRRTRRPGPHPARAQPRPRKPSPSSAARRPSGPSAPAQYARPVSVAAVILAAGAGTRFNRNEHGSDPGSKLLARTRGKPLVLWAIAPALEAELDELIVVSGAIDLRAVVPDGVTLLHNDDWARGQATSLRVALDWCARQGHLSAVVGAGDAPNLTAEAWRAVAAARGGPIVYATYHGRRGLPVRVDAEIWPILPISGDDGVASLAARRPELVTELACEGTPVDIDTREDLRRWS